MNDAQNAARTCERVTVALIPKAAADLAALKDRTGLSKTDLVNRAISLYEFIDQQAAGDAAVLIRQPDGTVAEVRFL